MYFSVSKYFQVYPIFACFPPCLFWDSNLSATVKTINQAIFESVIQLLSMQTHYNRDNPWDLVSKWVRQSLYLF